MQETVIPLSPQHQPQASHCKCELLVHYPHKSLEGEGRKLLHITTPVRLFLMAASRLWPDQVWHMLQWRLTGRQTQRNIRGAMALKQRIVKGNPTLPLTLRQLSPNKILKNFEMYPEDAISFQSQPGFFSLLQVILLIKDTSSHTCFNLHPVSAVFLLIPSPDIPFSLPQHCCPYCTSKSFFFCHVKSV